MVNSAANNGKILAYSSGTARGSASVDGVEREADLEEVFYMPDVHVRLLSLGKLESQGWGIQLKDGSIALRDQRGGLFAVLSKFNPVELTVIAPGSVIAGWTNHGGSKEPTHEAIVARLDEFTMVATAEGFRSGFIDLASSAGSSVLQGSRGSSSEWC